MEGTPGEVEGTPGEVEGTPGEVEGTPGEVEVRIKIFPVGEGEVLSTTEQISKMNVVIILLDMVK